MIAFRKTKNFSTQDSIFLPMPTVCRTMTFENPKTLASGWWLIISGPDRMQPIRQNNDVWEQRARCCTIFFQISNSLSLRTYLWFRNEAIKMEYVNNKKHQQICSELYFATWYKKAARLSTQPNWGNSLVEHEYTFW